ncbi:23S rRNA (uracil(1939)-C(5))-methyltransferase RlmD [bacterium]|nr:23S rRNA (uracil(1939)-C(5))-methyltransferase RlmD [bacterium]
MDKYFNSIKIERLGYGIYGIGKLPNGKNVLVERAVPGDIVDITITRAQRTFFYAKINKLITPSNLRNTSPICPIFHKCGGCTYKNVSYDDQIKMQEGILHELVKREGLIIRNISFIPSEDRKNYRIKSKFYINPEGYLSYSGLRSNRLVPITNCPILVDEINRVVKRINNMVMNKGNFSKRFENIEIYEADNGVGIHFIVRGVNDRVIKRVKEMVKRFKIISYTITDTRKGQFSVYGKKLLVSYNKVQYKFYPGTFIQTNKYTTEKMLFTIENYIKIHKISGDLIDLYAGLGFFSYYFKQYFNRLYLVENSPYAVNDMRGMFSGMGNISIYEKSVNSAITYIKKLKLQSDLVILDPPRTNPPDYVFEKISSLNAKFVIYISCNPPALLHDLKKFIGKYHIDNLVGFDMFPNTYHQEVIAFLRKKERKK